MTNQKEIMMCMDKLFINIDIHIHIYIYIYTMYLTEVHLTFIYIFIISFHVTTLKKFYFATM